MSTPPPPWSPELELAGRAKVLLEPLADALAQIWPAGAFNLDSDAAMARPGAPIGIAWQDGPPASAVYAGLRPRWGPHADADSGCYPVSTHRTLSDPVLLALLLLAPPEQLLPGAEQQVAEGPNGQLWLPEQLPAWARAAAHILTPSAAGQATDGMAAWLASPDGARLVALVRSQVLAERPDGASGPG